MAVNIFFFPKSSKLKNRSFIEAKTSKSILTDLHQTKTKTYMQMKLPKIQDISGDSNTRTAVQLRTEWIGYLQCKRFLENLTVTTAHSFFVIVAVSLQLYI
uniref:Uncharacterized protein n=1 Tax=Mus musculus TaxID=10090 RepID=Q9D4H0_MOUSE|nr:unnamed protein product [Mus musculus]